MFTRFNGAGIDTTMQDSVMVSIPALKLVVNIEFDPVSRWKNVWFVSNSTFITPTMAIRFNWL